MISPSGNWIPDPTKNVTKAPRATGTGLEGEGMSEHPDTTKGASNTPRQRVARNAKAGMQRMSPHTIALAILIALPFSVFVTISIYKSGMWPATLIIAVIFVIRHRRRTGGRAGNADRRIRLPLDRSKKLD